MTSPSKFEQWISGQSADDPAQAQAAALYAELVELRARVPALELLLGAEMQLSTDRRTALAHLSARYEVQRERVRMYQDQELARRWDQALQQLWRDTA